jgi:hypothetical protein
MTDRDIADAQAELEQLLDLLDHEQLWDLMIDSEAAR